jgi:predicted RNA-binding protein with PIN domain
MSGGRTLYLFDGYNLLYAGRFSERSQLVDALASFVATVGARGVVVFDGRGEEVVLGALEVRFAPHADTLLERLAVAERGRREVILVSSDATLVGTAGREVAKLSSATFLRELTSPVPRPRPAGGLSDKLDAATRAALERLRRGE